MPHHHHPCPTTPDPTHTCRYIIASKPDEYVFVYYRGQNDAWKGYGGATVYTRSVWAYAALPSPAVDS